MEKKVPILNPGSPGTIEEIEKRLEEAGPLSKEFYADLSYLHASSRFRANPMFRKSDFFTYIKNRFNLTRQAYYVLRLAYVRFSSETEQYGPGVVTDIIKKVGTKRAPLVIKKINEEAKKAPMTAERIKRIIDELTGKVKLIRLVED